MSKNILVISDQHAHPDFHNNRADWLGEYIKESKPDIVVNIGDAADLASLSAYDKGKASFNGRNYEKDIDAHLDFQERLWKPTRKAKKKKPYRVVLIGNHEQRIQRVLDTNSELAGDRFGVSFRNLDFSSYYNEVVPYTGATPGVWQTDGISFAHYFISGVMGRPIGGEHHAHSLIQKNYTSCVCGHSHTADFAVRTSSTGRKIMGVVAGVYQDYESPWAGLTNRLWWPGVVQLNNVDNGVFDPQFISLESLKRNYG